MTNEIWLDTTDLSPEGADAVSARYRWLLERYPVESVEPDFHDDDGNVWTILHLSESTEGLNIMSEAKLTIAVEQKSTGTAYLLWFFLGAFGAHQFYLGKTGRAVSMALTLGWLTVGLWIDMFTIPRQVRAVNDELLAAAKVAQARLNN